MKKVLAFITITAIAIIASSTSSAAGKKNVEPDLRYGEIIVPADIHIASGIECNLWWSSIANIDEGDKSVYFETFLYDATGTEPVQRSVRLMNMERGIRFTPREDCIGSTYVLRIVSHRTSDRQIISDVRTRLHISSPKAGSGCRNILMMGDSRTWQSFGGHDGVTSLAERCKEKAGNKTITTELRHLLCENGDAEFTFCGHKISETDPEVRNCADNGQVYSYPSRMFKEAGGIKSYLSANGMKTGNLDYATIMFGINDISDWGISQIDQFGISKAKIPAIIDNAKVLVDEILASYPKVKILMVIEPTTCASQDGWAMWGGGTTSRTTMEEMEQVSKYLRKELISTFDEGKYSANVTICAAGLWCDRKYGFPFYMDKVSSRQDNATKEVFIECVHPSDVGYGQIADGIFSTIKYLEQ